MWVIILGDVEIAKHLKRFLQMPIRLELAFQAFKLHI